VLCFVCEVPARIHIDLNQPPEGSISSTELELESGLRSLRNAAANASCNEKINILRCFNRLLEELGIDDIRKLAAAQTKSLWCYCMCSSETQLQQLHDRYESGRMKSVFEEIFSLLVNRTITIRELKWKPEDRDASLSAIRRLNSPGECHVNNDVIAYNECC
jgi:hypothetical protein